MPRSRDNLVEPIHLTVIDKVESPDYLDAPCWHPFPDDEAVDAGDTYIFDFSPYVNGADIFYVAVGDGDFLVGDSMLSHKTESTDSGELTFNIRAVQPEGVYTDQALTLTINT